MHACRKVLEEVDINSTLIVSDLHGILDEQLRLDPIPFLKVIILVTYQIIILNKYYLLNSLLQRRKQ